MGGETKGGEMMSRVMANMKGRERERRGQPVALLWFAVVGAVLMAMTAVAEEATPKEDLVAVQIHFFEKEQLKLLYTEEMAGRSFRSIELIGSPAKDNGVRSGIQLASSVVEAFVHYNPGLAIALAQTRTHEESTERGRKGYVLPVSLRGWIRHEDIIRIKNFFMAQTYVTSFVVESATAPERWWKRIAQAQPSGEEEVEEAEQREGSLPRPTIEKVYEGWRTEEGIELTSLSCVFKALTAWTTANMEEESTGIQQLERGEILRMLGGGQGEDNANGGGGGGGGEKQRSEAERRLGGRGTQDGLATKKKKKKKYTALKPANYSRMNSTAPASRGAPAAKTDDIERNETTKEEGLNVAKGARYVDDAGRTTLLERALATSMHQREVMRKVAEHADAIEHLSEEEKMAKGNALTIQDIKHAFPGFHDDLVQEFGAEHGEVFRHFEESLTTNLGWVKREANDIREEL